MSDSTPGFGDEAQAMRQFSCTNCGAELRFAPGTEALTCPRCGTENRLPTEGVVEEIDYHATIAALAGQADTVEVLTAKCRNCAAQTTLPENVTSGECAYCGTPVVLEGASTRLIKPESLLPFHVKRGDAEASFSKWLGSRWFAPSALKRHSGSSTRLVGMYVPHWTFDAQTTTDYTGQRGDHYYTTQSYTTTVNGKSVLRQRQVQQTRWSPAWGRVFVPFDDVLVCASTSLPQVYRPNTDGVEIKKLVPFADEYLAGFQTESYTVDLENGFDAATQIMAGRIDTVIRQDIGGDVQRIATRRTQYHGVTFKHVLLPLWISSYRFGDKVYRFTVDARTGKVQGERPYSKVKIALAILAVILVLMFFFSMSDGGGY